MCKCRPQVRTPFCGKGDCVWPGAKPEGARTAMILTEAREIISYCKDRHMDFFNCRFSEADFKEAKGYIEGHKAALESVREHIFDACKDKASVCADCSDNILFIDKLMADQK